jgi:hypothetical protein
MRSVNWSRNAGSTRGEADGCDSCSAWPFSVLENQDLRCLSSFLEMRAWVCVGVMAVRQSPFEREAQASRNKRPKTNNSRATDAHSPNATRNTAKRKISPDPFSSRAQWLCWHEAARPVYFVAVVVFHTSAVLAAGRMRIGRRLASGAGPPFPLASFSCRPCICATRLHMARHSEGMRCPSYRLSANQRPLRRSHPGCTRTTRWRRTHCSSFSPCSPGASSRYLQYTKVATEHGPSSVRNCQ